MAKLTDARVATLKAHFNTGDQPSEANFADLIQYIQEGIEDHQHDGTGDGDGTGILDGPITIADGNWLGIGAALERIVFDAAGDISVMGANFSVGSLVPIFKLEGANSGSCQLGVRAYSLTTTHSPGMFFTKSHHATIGTDAATIDGDALGEIRFYGVDSGPGLAMGARIHATQKGAAGAAFVEADLVLFTHTNAVANTNQLYLDGGTGNVGIGTVPTGKCHIDQETADAAIPVLKLDQADLSEGFIDFLGTSAASAVGPISTWKLGATCQGFVRVEINGVARWMPFYSAPTS